MNKKQIITVIGVAIVLLIGGGLWVKSQNKNKIVLEKSKAEQAKELIDKLYLLDHNGGILMSDDARRIFNATTETLKQLGDYDLTSLIDVINKLLSGKATEGDKNYLVDLSDTLSL